MAGNGATQEKQRPKKRRRRKRGRKVYARDGRIANGAAPEARPASDAGPERRSGSPSPNPVASSAAPALAVNSPHLAPVNRARGSAGRDGAAPVYAALDLGTNNCRLLVAVPTRPGQFRVVDAFSRIVRLGEGLAANGRLNDQAMDRAVEALGACAEKLRSREVRSARLIATEACRSAENGAAFLARVAEETGLRLEIIDRETEARL